jgi:hypothetical protein
MRFGPNKGGIDETNLSELRLDTFQTEREQFLGFQFSKLPIVWWNKITIAEFAVLKIR